MRTVLNGQIKKCLNIQHSIVEQELNLCSMDPSSFLANVTNRHVRLLKCGSDTALIIPYLNNLLIRLDGDRWIRDADVPTLQPFHYFNGFSEVRRAVNILLAVEYPGEGDSLRLLKSYAQKGELYSMKLRDQILSAIKLKNRVSVRGLKVTCDDVFGEFDTLVREMIQNRQMMKSEISSERIPDESDVSYDAFYLGMSYRVRNNIDWETGVPMTGVACATESK